MIRPMLSLALLLAPVAALADPVDARAARDLLFSAAEVEVVTLDVASLSEQDRQVLTLVAQSQKYYAAVAFAPGVGIMAEPTVMAANYHHIEAARTAALAGCNERRSGGADCVIALEVRPVGWEERALQLSADATADFEENYRRVRGSRAFAVSTTSGQWGIGRGDDAESAALTACQGDSDVADCAVVIRD